MTDPNVTQCLTCRADLTVAAPEIDKSHRAICIGSCSAEFDDQSVERVSLRQLCETVPDAFHAPDSERR